jgi:hypothetical protein
LKNGQWFLFRGKKRKMQWIRTDKCLPDIRDSLGLANTDRFSHKKCDSLDADSRNRRFGEVERVRIGLVNTDKLLSDELSKLASVVPIANATEKIDTLFIDWIPLSRKTPENTPKLQLQAEIIENYIVKKIPAVLFDRYLSISTKEFKWLHKFNVTFCEPALDYRRNFIYLPFWTILKSLEGISLNVSDRKYDLVYRGNISDKIRSFEKYYLEYIKCYAEDNVCYSGNIEKEREKLYMCEGLHKRDFSFSDAKLSVIIGSVRDYKIGHLDSTFVEALNENCVPMLPEEHRYYSAFSWITPTITETKSFTDMYSRTYIGLIKDIYNDIEKRYPEMVVSNTAEMICELLK